MFTLRTSGSSPSCFVFSVGVEHFTGGSIVVRSYGTGGIEVAVLDGATVSFGGRNSYAIDVV
jgi:hypothetical protein